MGIEVLPENVSNQIAAGEVIERPVNVVKELIENSLDGQATRIEVQFRSGGSSFIRVNDNGVGMNTKEASLCFKRHATSKLKRFEDLQNLHSFGFRGEALPSIASVAKVTLITRSIDQELGTRVVINGGIEETKTPFASPVGTSFTIEQLFYNVPVRRKFLKSEATEAAHIVSLVRLYAIAYPQVHFSIKQEDRLVFSSPQCTCLKDRISELWTKKQYNTWLDLSETDGRYQISGLICPPGEGYLTSHEVFTFLNKRLIASTFLLGTLRDCYRTYLPPKTYPSAFLFLQIPENEIDVNVHPTKREVRFRNEFKVRQFIQTAIKRNLENIKNQPLGIAHVSPFQNLSWPAKNTYGSTLSTFTPSPSQVAKLSDFITPEAQTVPPTFPASTETMPSSSSGSISLTDFTRSFKNETASPLPQSTSLHTACTSPICEKFEASSKDDAFHLKFFTLWQNQYAFFSEAGSLLILDCKGAQQRIWYEQVLKLLKEEYKAVLQTLLFPHPFKLDVEKAAYLSEAVDYLNFRNICKIQEQADCQFILQAIPQWIPVEEIDLFIEQLTASLMQQGQNQTLEQLFEPLLIKLAFRRSFVPVESQLQVEKLHQTLSLCKNYITDPQGNPLWKRLSLPDFFKGR